MRTIAIIQARLNSTRLPNKVLLKIGNKSIVEIISNKLKMSKKINEFIFSIPDNKVNSSLNNYLKKRKIKVYLGNQDNVLDRYYKTAKKFSADIVVRLTADNPLLDVQLIDKMIDEFISNKIDFLDNNSPRTFPNGLDVEIFNFETLKKTWKSAKSKFEKEHVSVYMKKNKFIKKKNFYSKIDYSKFRFTIDERVDYDFICSVYNKLKKNRYNWKFFINYLKKDKLLLKNFIDEKIIDDEVYPNKGQKIWKYAKGIIAGGNSMISKNPELYPSKNWPVYFSRTKGCYVWDIEGNKFIDLATMGIGTNILGYNNKFVDKAVLRVINQGNISTLNSTEEIDLAEELLKINDWADKVCFARTGGEANAIAVRLARASTKRQKILVCGYHGWHDWYLASKKKEEKNIRENYLPFYSTIGVPDRLKGLIEFFEYNNFKQLSKKLREDKDIGIIKMETMRNQYPRNNFLNKIKKIVNEKNLILILDESTTGFREKFGGLYEKYNIKPDLAIYGKALGNGYAITAIVGKKKIMDFYNKAFISSTFWSERIGFAAGLATLKYMKKIKSWKKITNTGIFIRNGWRKLAKKYSLKIKINGIPALSNFVFLNKNNKIYSFLITQEMLKSNILATNTIYVSTCHTKTILKKYFKTLDKIFKIIKNEKIEKIKEMIEKVDYKRFRKDLSYKNYTVK